MNNVMIPRANGYVTPADLNAIIDIIEMALNRSLQTQDGYLILDKNTPIVVKDSSDGKLYQVTVDNGEVKTTEWDNPRVAKQG